MLDLIFRGRSLVFETALGADEVTRRLAREVTPPKWQHQETRTQLFEGTFADGRFHMVRLVRGRNSFRPVIEGRLSPTPRGTRIDVQLRLHPLVLGLSAILFGIGGLVAVIAAAESLARREPAPQLIVVPLMAAASAVIAVAASLEARKATRLLARVFDSEPTWTTASPATENA